MFFGAQYYRPPFPEPSRWERDLRNMAELNFNTVKLWAVWNWIERRPGEFDFSELDALVDIASKNQLKVVINTIPEGAPYWTLEGNEDALYRTSKNEPVTYGGPPNLPSAGWPGLCGDKPEAAALTARFIEATAAHFAENDAVAAIDVWNEPHLEPMFDYRSELLCYCPHSVGRFIAWLQRRYQSLENLNKAWFRSYTDWSQVSAPPRFGTWTDMIDWRLFWIDNLQSWLRMRVAAARKGAPGKPVQTHVAYSATVGNDLAGGLANELGDEFSLAREVDIFGLSSFPKWLMGKEHVYTHLLHNEIISEASRGKPFYQVELQGGGGKAGLLGGEIPDRRDVTLWNFNTIAAGGRGTVYWQYAPEPAGIESPGFGLTGFAGENTERSLAAAECARKLNTELFDNARKARCKNAVYLSRHSDVLCFSADRREALYAGSVDGIYRAAYRQMIPVRFIHEDYIEHIPDEGLGTIYLPMPLVLSREETDAFAEFVRSGGTLVAEACPGLYDRGGRLDRESTALRELFGLEHVEIQGLPAGSAVTAYAGGSPCFSGSLYRQLVRPCSGVEVLAAFEDGKPALTERALGKGKAVWLGAFAALHSHETGDGITQALLTRYMHRGGYESIDEISLRGNSTADGPVPVVRLLETPDRYVLVFVNHMQEEAEITVRFNAVRNIPGIGCGGKVLTVKLPPSCGDFVAWEKE